ncbi:MAG: hypothetical protein E7665_09555 [Ruminococcaceae bacterium]|nr:hypothetical protein [Oscillospiraceae bacterium]
MKGRVNTMKVTLDLISSNDLTISPYIHGTFFENFGTTTYDGIYVGKDSPIENINGIRKSVIDGIKEAGITAIRWPGGCCADHYHWKWGIGKERKNKMFMLLNKRDKEIWRNDFGTDEFIELCRLTGAEPVLVINTATGTPEEFRDWFEYCNGPAETEYGAMRAENGHPEPYNVKIWGIGNTDENVWVADYNNPESYARNYMRFTTVLRETIDDQDMKVIGLGLSKRHMMPGWVEKCLDVQTGFGTRRAPDMLSVHHYIGGAKGTYRECGDGVDYSDEQYYYTLDAVKHYEQDIELHRQYIAEHGNKRQKTTICFDEWGLWHPEATIEAGQRQRQTMRDGIFAALTLHLFYRKCDIVEFAMETQTCNLLQSLFETQDEKCFKTPTFYVMKMFRDHLGNTPVALQCDDEMTDVFASKSSDGKKLVVTIANKDLYESKEAITAPEGYTLSSASIIYAEDVRAYNTFEDPFVIKESVFEGDTIPPHSIVKFVFEK